MVVKVHKYANGGPVLNNAGNPKYTRSYNSAGRLQVKRNTTIGEDIHDIVGGVANNVGGLVGDVVGAFKKRKAGVGNNYADGGRVGKLGSGSRFAAIEASAKASGARNPAAVAAAAGIKAHGKKQMAKWAAAGRKAK